MGSEQRALGARACARLVRRTPNAGEVTRIPVFVGIGLLSRSAVVEAFWKGASRKLFEKKRRVTHPVRNLTTGMTLSNLK